MAEKRKQQRETRAIKNDPVTQNVNALLEKCNIALQKLETKTSEQVPVTIQAPEVLHVQKEEVKPIKILKIYV